ncbi:ABC transporter permease [Candidatus Thorarchaeota archaeon]|nr:MAG: ABC transporter permease [Candidatus Thorarchaeota archaeon]
MKMPTLDVKTLWMIRKEIREVTRSRWLILGFIISPMFAWMFQGAFLSFIVYQTSEEPEMVYITLEDDGYWGRHLYESIAGNQSNLLINPLVNITLEEAQQKIADKTISVWVYIPAGFSQELNTTTESTMQIVVNTASFRATAAASRIDAHSREIINEVEIIREVTIYWYTIAPEANYGHQLAIFLVMLTSVLAPAPYISKSFAGEREAKTLEALLVVPMSRIKILGAKLVSGIALTAIYSVFTAVGILTYNLSIIMRVAGLAPELQQANIDLYTVNANTIPLIMFCQFLVLLCAIGIGVVISCLAKDRATAESVNSMIMLIPTFVIGILGFTGSILQYGGILGWIILAIPFSHAILFLNAVLAGTGTLIGLSINVGYMMGFTIVFLFIGAKLFEREAIIS